LNEEKIDHEKKLNQSKQVLLAARKKISAQNEEIQSQTAELENLKKRINTAGENLNGNEFSQLSPFFMLLEISLPRRQEINRFLNRDKYCFFI
jgi:DNA helicase IV